jgi:hypothetical protein
LNALQISAGHKKTRAFAETLVAGCLREDSLKECAWRVDSNYQYVDKKRLEKSAGFHETCASICGLTCD